MDHGPLPYGIYADNGLFAYKTGIYTNDCQSAPNHEVVTIGWGNDAQHGLFWYSLNSWGAGWGDAGAFKALGCVPTDFTIPGDITGDVANFPTPWNEAVDPTPAPPTGPPTPAPPTAAPTPQPTAPPTPAPLFHVTGSGCAVDNDGCVASKNF